MSSFSDFEAAVFGSRSSGGAEPGSGGTGGRSAYTGGTKLNIPGVAGKLGFSTGIAMLDAALGLPVSKAFGAAGNKAIESAINASRSKAVTSGAFLGALPFAGNNAGPAAAPSGQTGGQSNTPGMTGTGTQEQSTLGKTLEEAKKDYDDAVAEYEARGKQLNKLLASTGDYAGYGKDLDLAKTTAADAKAKLEEAAEAYKAAGGNVDIDVNQRIGKTIIGGGEGTLSDLLGSAGTAYEGAVRGSKAQIERDLADMQKQAEKAQKNYDETLSKYGGDVNNVNVKAAARALAEIKSNQELYQGMLDNKSLENTTAAIYGKSDEWGEKSARNIAEAKEGLGKTGQFLVDTGAAGVQLLGDIALGKASGLGMMPVMGIRSFGGGANEARQAGATYEQQFAYGGATAAIEMLTEKLADGLAGAAGKGAADDVAKEIIRKWAKTDAGRTALRAVYGVAGEAAEEAISDLVNPLARAIYDKGDSAKESYLTKEGRKELYQEMLHDALVGGALGGLGSIGSIATGQNAAELADMRMRDASMGDVQSQTNNAFDVLFGRMTPEQSQAREAAALARLGINEQAAPAPAAPEAPAPVAQETTGQDALLEAAGITPAVQEAPAPVAENNLQAPASDGKLVGTDPRVQRAAEMAKAGSDDAAIMEETGLFMFSDGTLVDPKTETVVGSVNGGTGSVQGMDDTPGPVEQAPRTDEAGASSIDGRGVHTDTQETSGRELWDKLDKGSQQKAIDAFEELVSREDDLYYSGEIDLMLYESGSVENFVGDLYEEWLRDPIKFEHTAEYLGDISGIVSAFEGIASQQQSTDQPTIGQTATDERGYTGKVVDTQDRVFETNLTEDEKQIPGLTPEEAAHIRHSDEEVDARAKARLENPNVARAELLEADSWNDEDTATAGYLIQQEIEAAENAETEEERAAIYKRLAELKKQWNKQGTEEGRALRQRQRFVAEDMVAAAAEVLYEERGADQKALRKLNPRAKDKIMSTVRSFAKQYNALQPGDTAGLVSLIKAVSEARRTTGLFSKENGRAVNFALEQVAQQEGGAEFLSDLLTTQIKSVASDYIKPGIINQLKSWRFMAMLSNPATTMSNLSGNFTFGSIMDTMANNIALPFDMLVSRFTGTREVAGELGAFSPTKWKGSYDAFLRSFLEVSLDAETADSGSKYTETKGNTFKMVGGPIERLLATMQKYQGYALKSSDEAAKGGTTAQVKKGLGKLAEKGKANADSIEQLAKESAEYRTFQTKDGLAEGTAKVRNWIDEHVGVGNERTGRYGIGSDIMPFAQIPANIAIASVEAQPGIGVVKALGDTAKLIIDGINKVPIEPGRQAKVAKAWGRAGNGAAITAMFMAAAARGLLRDNDDDNKDVNAQRRAEGTYGTQLNLSAIIRGFDENDKPDDIWIDLAWIPPLNGLANLGADLWAEKQADGKISFKDFAGASFDSMIDSFMEFPAVSKISSMYNTWKYSEAETGWGKAGEVALTGAGQTASGFIVPNALRAAATGRDPYQRDTYQTDSPFDGIVNNLKSGIPGMRETLPVKTDAFGNPVMNDGGALNFFDKTLIPGNITRHDKQSEASSIIENVIAATGDSSIQPRRNGPYSVKFENGGDAYKLTAGEREAYKETRGREIDRLVTEAAGYGAFANATPEEQAAVIKEIESYADDKAKAELAKRNGEEYTSKYQTLLEGSYEVDGEVEKRPLDEKNLGEYISFYAAANAVKNSRNYDALTRVYKNFQNLDENTREVLAMNDDFAAILTGVKTPGGAHDIPKLENLSDLPRYAEYSDSFKDAVKDLDYRGIDSIVGQFDSLNGNLQEVLAAKSKNGGQSTLNHLVEFSHEGIGSQSYFELKDSTKDAQEYMDRSSNQSGAVKLMGIADANISQEEKDRIVESGVYDLSKAATTAYDLLRSYGFEPKDIADWFNNADWYASGKDKEPEASGTLNAYEVAVGLSKLDLTPSQRDSLYKAFRDVLWNRYDSEDSFRKNTSYTQAFNKSPNYGRTVGRPAEKTEEPDNFLAQAAGLTNGNVAYDPESILAALLG